MNAEAKVYRREYMNKIALLLSLSGLWPEDSRQSRRIIFLGYTVSAEGAFFYAHWNSTSLINLKKVNDVDGIIDILNSFIFFATKSPVHELAQLQRDIRFIFLAIIAMSDVVQIYYHNYKAVMISVLLVSGLWPDDSKQSRVLRTFLSVFTILLPTILILGMVNFTIHNSLNVIFLIGQIGLIISFGFVCIKMITMAVMWRGVKSLNGGLSSLFENDLKVPEYRPHLLAYFRAFYRFFKFHYFYCLGLTVFSTSMPIIAAFRGRYVRVHAVRPPVAYTPGDAVHWITFVLEITASAIMPLNSIGIDSVFGLYSLQMVGELRLLSHRFRSLKSGENYKRELKECIDRHCMLNDQKYMMERVFGLTSLLLAISCAIIICSLIYQLTQSKSVTLFQAIFAIDYIVVKLTQAYTYAWFGNTITVESERCVQSIHHSRWADSGDVRAMKDMLIIQAQKPMHITALGIMIVRLDMFVKIAHASISYFFLLKTIEAKLT